MATNSRTALTAVPQIRYGFRNFFATFPSVIELGRGALGYRGRLRTLKHNHQVEKRVEDGLESSNPGDMTMKQVECREAPPRCPYKYIVAPGKKPYQGDIRKAQNTGPISGVTQDLGRDCRPTDSQSATNQTIEYIKKLTRCFLRQPGIPVCKRRRSLPRTR